MRVGGSGVWWWRRKWPMPENEVGEGFPAKVVGMGAEVVVEVDVEVVSGVGFEVEVLVSGMGVFEVEVEVKGEGEGEGREGAGAGRPGCAVCEMWMRWRWWSEREMGCGGVWEVLVVDELKVAMVSFAVVASVLL